MTINVRSVDQYLSSLPDNKVQVLQELRQLIQEILPNSIELISYNMPAYKLNQIVIWFAACKGHFSIYMKPKFYIGFEEERSKFNGTKSAIHFNWESELPRPFLYRLLLNAKNLDEIEVRQKKK